MSLEPLLTSSLMIQIHTFAALTAVPLAALQFAAPKGTPSHRAIGWGWVVLMAIVAITGFFIWEIRMIGPFSPIHLLSIGVLAGLASGVWLIRRGFRLGHWLVMAGVTSGLLIAGAFTFLPGRIMHAVVTGG